MNGFGDRQAGQLANQIVKTYDDDAGTNFIDVANLPARQNVIEIIELLLEVLFPGYTGRRVVTKADISRTLRQILKKLYTQLTRQIELALRHQCRMKACPGCDCSRMAESLAVGLLNQLPHLRRTLKGDVLAAYEGDPAAKSFEEVVISYPYITAIAVHRIAHYLYCEGVELIPRMMSEYAHSLTGIDIHPGARIGGNFFIDHGTGVVIGETAVIGDNVKLYQGVTLGALSFPKDEKGKILKGGKRHPTIGDNVTIYAEATILGDVIIGHNAVIGGNVWLKESVPPGVTVAMPAGKKLFKKNRAGQKGGT